MRESLEFAKQAVASGRQAEALCRLRAACGPDAEPAILARAVRWAKSIEWIEGRPLRVAYLGGGTLDQLVDLVGFRIRLSLEDIAVFKANWRNKADNLREIAAELNIGLDSFVFVDDNPAERELVRIELPMVATPEMPANPADFVNCLNRMAYFETVSFSREDRLRGRMYRENTARNAARSRTTDVSEYLAGLSMRAGSGEADSFHIPRMAQLLNKSNQFHPTTARFTEAELRELSEREEYIVRWFSLRDKFGDYGLVSVLVLRRENDTAVIDAWAMSCRVLERGMEEFIVREISALALAGGAVWLVGRYIPSQKNGLVADLYSRLGFSEIPAAAGESRWRLPLPTDRTGEKLFIEQSIGKE